MPHKKGIEPATAEERLPYGSKLKIGCAERVKQDAFNRAQTNLVNAKKRKSESATIEALRRRAEAYHAIDPEYVIPLRLLGMVAEHTEHARTALHHAVDAELDKMMVSNNQSAQDPAMAGSRALLAEGAGQFMGCELKCSDTSGSGVGDDKSTGENCGGTAQPSEQGDVEQSCDATLRSCSSSSKSSGNESTDHFPSNDNTGANSRAIAQSVDTSDPDDGGPCTTSSSNGSSNTNSSRNSNCSAEDACLDRSNAPCDGGSAVCEKMFRESLVAELEESMHATEAQFHEQDMRNMLLRDQRQILELFNSEIIRSQPCNEDEVLELKYKYDQQWVRALVLHQQRQESE